MENFDFDEPEFEGAPEEPKRAPAPAPAPAPKPAMPTPKQKAIQQATPSKEDAIRYVPYEIPKRIGVLDRQLNKPILEDEDILKVIMAQLADIKNDLEEIKSFYN
jgi:hypothetical protein